MPEHNEFPGMPYESRAMPQESSAEQQTAGRWREAWQTARRKAVEWLKAAGRFAKEVGRETWNALEDNGMAADLARRSVAASVEAGRMVVDKIIPASKSSAGNTLAGFAVSAAGEAASKRILAALERRRAARASEAAGGAA